MELFNVFGKKEDGISAQLHEFPGNNEPLPLIFTVGSIKPMPALLLPCVFNINDTL